MAVLSWDLGRGSFCKIDPSLLWLSSLGKNRFKFMSCGVDLCLKLSAIVMKTSVLEPVRFLSRCRFLLHFFNYLSFIVTFSVIFWESYLYAHCRKYRKI